MTETYSKKPQGEQRDWQEKLCDMVLEEWDRGYQYVGPMNEMFDDIYSMLRGERPEKNYDWQSNLSLNKVFQVVWTTVSYCVKKIYGGSPIIGVEGFNQKGCWQREILIDKWMEKDRYFTKLVIIILRLVLNGTVFIKKSWNQQIENIEGKSIPIVDGPEDYVANNKDIVFDWMLEPGQSINKGRFVIHREMVDLSALHGSKIGYINLDKIEFEDLTPNSSGMLQDHKKNAQKDQQDEKPKSDIYREVEVKERMGIFPVIKEDGEWRPVFELDEIYGEDSEVEWKEMIVTVVCAQKPVLVRFDENKYGIKTWIDGHLYFDPERWMSTGQVEPFKDIQTALNDNINAMFDEINQNLMPPVIFNKFSLVEWDTIQYAPQQKWMVGGDPNSVVMPMRPSNITGDAWARHQLLDSEIQLTSSVTPPVQGMGNEKTATQGVLNAQFSTGKFDFIISMIEQTILIPSVRMSVLFAQKFAHPLTFIAILGEPFEFEGWMETYKYKPSASSVKLDQQKEKEIQEDIQLMQIVASVQNPNVPKVMNYLLGNILRNRNEPKMAEMFDEGFYEPSSMAGNVNMLNRMLPAGTPSNQNGIEMSVEERSVRGGMVQ